MNKLSMVKGVVISGVISTATLAHAEFVQQPFIVDESSVVGAFDNQFTASRFSGTYNEILTINPDATFATGAWGYFNTAGLLNTTTQLIVPVENQLATATGNGEGLSTNTYVMYFVFNASGTFSGTNEFTGSTGSFDLFIDPSKDTSFSFTGTNVNVADGISDDYRIAFADLIDYGIGKVENPGSYEIVWSDFALTDEGKLYFIDPVDFYFRVLIDGDFDLFNPSLANYSQDSKVDPACVDTPGFFCTRKSVNYSVAGDVSGIFEGQVPEPSSLALLGLSMLALGWSRKRS